MSTRKLIQFGGGVKYLVYLLQNFLISMQTEPEKKWFTWLFIPISQHTIKIYMYTAHNDNSKVNRSGKYSKEYTA